MEAKDIRLADGTPVTDTMQAIDESVLHWIKIACALCNDVLFFEKLDVANPIDKALISFALKNGIDIKELLLQYKRIYDKPFDSENRYMVGGFEKDAREYYFAKGDPEIILRMCNRYMTVDGSQKESEFEFWRTNRLNMEAISQSGGTAIAMAYSNFPAKDYTFLCLIQLENPVQVGVPEIIGEIMERGMRSILLTGDRAEAAVRVAEECGITKESKTYLSGRTIDRMESSEVARQSEYCSVFARLLPSQKGFLIRLLQQNGHCVGMVGDGVNDGIALKAADIGISFVKDSSPVASRLAKVLINDLADLLRLLESARRIKRRAAQLKVFRVLIVAGSLLSLYLWIFAPHFLGR
jgi:Ca2+-transporting ATPase